MKVFFSLKCVIPPGSIGYYLSIGDADTEGAMSSAATSYRGPGSQFAATREAGQNPFHIIPEQP